MDYLKARRIQAKEWLERIKRSFSVRTNAREKLRRGADGFSGINEKLKLTDMKAMVAEGQAICDDGDVEEARRTAQVRELNRAQQAVEAADEVIFFI
jgi:hypothetical protein